MIPGMNARQMQQMMKQMGIQQVEVPATQVIILTPEKRIVIDHPQVSKVNMMGQQTWQVVGTAREERVDILPDINDDDVRTVMEQADVPKDKALSAIQRAKGDLAQAILDLKEE
jgi:alpha-NAC-related protein